MSYRCRDGHESDDPEYCSVCGIAITPSVSAASAPPTATAPPAGAPSGSGTCPSCGEPRTDPDARFCEVCRYDFVAGVPGPPPGGPSGSARPAPAPAPATVLSAPAAAASPAGSGSAPLASLGDPGGSAGGPAGGGSEPAEAAKAPDPGPTPSAPASAPSGEAESGAAPSSPPSTRTAPVRPHAWEAVVAVDCALDVDPDPEEPCPENQPERVFHLDLPETLIGRRDEPRGIRPEIPLNDPGASRRHAKLLLQPDGSLAVLDLASTNGTKLNGEDVAPGLAHALREGDRITLGRWTRIIVRGRS